MVSPEKPPSGVSVEIERPGLPASPESGAPAIQFFADGSSTGGDVVIRTEGRQARVRVEWLSGRAKVVAE